MKKKTELEMKWVKIFKVHTHDRYEDSSYESIGVGVTDWEEITPEDLQFLKINLHMLQNDYNAPDGYSHWILVEKPIRTVLPIITTLKEMIQKKREEQEKFQAEQEKQKLAAKMKREMKKNATRKELYEELRKEFEK